ncbi:MAG: hypothetical protein IJA94_00680 [Bacilli bacterium]|nr:hypothetical protein [Bacilli bacterium]
MDKLNIEKQISKISDNKVLSFQIKYKHDFEKILSSMFEFNLIDGYFNELSTNIPKIKKDGNFYFENSTLPSEYLYLRNNIYIERLSAEELVYLEDCMYKNETLSAEFLNRTFKRVLFENTNTIMLGLSRKENIVNGKSLIFELGYDQKKFTDISQLNFIKTYALNLRMQLESVLKEQLGCDISLHEYNCIPDLYFSEDNNLKIS